mmetsp:Transcript_36900/g.71175  ORF Transcript_36900/g.71175 Transcript_36900/m.71175 type:complete len:297 (+) Transcript_36900:152-1042(+)
MEEVGEDELQLRGGGGDTKGESGKRMWEVFPGKNLICCRGRCITGPDPSIFIFNLVLTFAALGLFYAFIAIRLHPIVIVIGFILHGISFYFLLRAAFTDPGILRRRKKPSSDEEGDPPTAIVNGKTVQLSYCHTCSIYRPPKCKHCRTCDNCVEEFDHHCPWVMNCVAKRNYRYFVGFVASISLLCIYVCACSIAIVVISVTGDQQPAGVILCAIILILFTGCLGITLCGFACFHCGLIAQGITTNEYIKGRADGGSSKTGCTGCMKNCYDVYCTDLPKPDLNLMVALFNVKALAH